MLVYSQGSSNNAGLWIWDDSDRELTDTSATYIRICKELIKKLWEKQVSADLELG